MPELCNINGELVPLREARVPVMDRGFLFGDSVYEVMRTRSGVPFAWPEHLERLRASADGIGLDLDHEPAGALRLIKDTLEAAGNRESYIRLVVTRGTGTAPNIDLSYAPGPPTWVVIVRELAVNHAPARLALIPRLRTDRRALDPGIKSGNYLNNLLGLAPAKARGATECLFLNHDGELTEASTSNFFLVVGGEVHTPPLRSGLLRGITRGLLFELCEQLGVPLHERMLTTDDLRGADEMFLSSTLRDLVPVVEIDGRPVGSGQPGKITTELSESFRDYCARLTRERYAPPFLEA